MRQAASRCVKKAKSDVGGDEMVAAVVVDASGPPVEGRLAALRRRMEHAMSMIGKQATLARLRKSRRLPLTEAAYNGHHEVLQVVVMMMVMVMMMMMMMRRRRMMMMMTMMMMMMMTIRWRCTRPSRPTTRGTCAAERCDLSNMHAYIYYFALLFCRQVRLEYDKICCLLFFRPRYTLFVLLGYGGTATAVPLVGWLCLAAEFVAGGYSLWRRPAYSDAGFPTLRDASLSKALPSCGCHPLSLPFVFPLLRWAVVLQSSCTPGTVFVVMF